MKGSLLKLRPSLENGFTPGRLDEMKKKQKGLNFLLFGTEAGSLYVNALKHRASYQVDDLAAKKQRLLKQRMQGK